MGVSESIEKPPKLSHVEVSKATQEMGRRRRRQTRRPGGPRRAKEIGMFMASNRFKIASGGECAFEKVKADEHDRLRFAPGFISLRFDRGPRMDGETLYFRITIWNREDDFLAWRISEQIHENVDRAKDDVRPCGRRSALQDFEKRFSKETRH